MGRQAARDAGMNGVAGGLSTRTRDVVPAMCPIFATTPLVCGPSNTAAVRSGYAVRRREGHHAARERSWSADVSPTPSTSTCGDASMTKSCTPTFHSRHGRTVIRPSRAWSRSGRCAGHARCSRLRHRWRPRSLCSHPHCLPERWGSIPYSRSRQPQRPRGKDSAHQ